VKTASAAAFAVIMSAGLAGAADMPVAYKAAPIVAWTWTGFYLGGQLGGGLAGSQFFDPAGPSIYGGTVRSPIGFGGGQVGYNWHIPNSAAVLGVDADAELMGSYGSATCLASSGFFISANCRVRPHAGGSLTGRIGWATGTGGRTLLYVKGGAAWLDERIDITTNNPFTPTTTAFSGVRWGWTAGLGVERALTPAWSWRLEYDYARFGDFNMATPASLFQVLPPFNAFVPTNGGTTGVSQNLQTVKLGLNYRIGEDMYARWQPAVSDYRLRGTDVGYIPDTEVEVGGRVWYSSGRFQKDLVAIPNQPQPAPLASRLTYDANAATGELFGRIDTTSNIFLKGFVGGGRITSGNMHDEDWVLIDPTFTFVIPYSNTLSAVSGDLAYGTFDAGYSLFRGKSANVGGFVGFNYYRENKQALGCSQIANVFSDCVPPIPNTIVAITEDDKWLSFRVGLNGTVTLADRLKLTADVAYLPFVAFRGFDNHLLRTDVVDTVSPESGSGQGVQLETILSYAVSNGFSVGAGGRYWAMWANNAHTNIFGTPCPCQALPVRTERYGAFLQASYKLDGLK
jgi:opacity protein-like surface antigen